MMASRPNVSADLQGTTSPRAANDEDPPKLPFVTTSDVLNQLNKNLKELATAGGEDSLTAGLEPRFELQKRLPDGSTIPASAADLAASDFKTKMQQSAKFVTEYLESDEDRAKWTENQRQVGNAYFAKADYQAAMDIYLTCLVVKQDNEAFLNQTLLPVLNNLAQCTLQLGMHKKTAEFCNIALEEVKKLPVQSVDPIAKCKIFYKRAKARRLTGSYALAREDLNEASLCLDKASSRTSTISDDSASTTCENKTLATYQPAIQKEFRLLELAEKEGRKNRQRQRRAMQKALQTESLISRPNMASNAAPLVHQNSPNDRALPTEDAPKEPRKYSTLRARKPAVAENSSDRGSASTHAKPECPRLDELSYWQYYCLVVARVAEVLLIWLGDEETKENVKQRME